ncbi:MAG: hypothetical protein V3U67_10425 [Gemmatimonadota bacterium]
MKRAVLPVAVALLVGASGTLAWTSVGESSYTAVDHEIQVLLGVPGQEGVKYKVVLTDEQFEDVMDGTAIVVQVDGSEIEDLVAQVTVKEKKRSRRSAGMGGGGSGGGSGGDSGW